MIGIQKCVHSVGTVAGVPITIEIPSTDHAAPSLIEVYLNGLRIDNTAHVVMSTLESSTAAGDTLTSARYITVVAAAVTADGMLLSAHYLDLQEGA